MGTRFVPTHQADKRAIEFYLCLREIEQMPLLKVWFSKDRKKIIIGDKNDSMMFRDFKVDNILLLDPLKAKENGGTFKALLNSWKEPKPRVTQSEVDEGVRSLLWDD